MRQKKPKGFFTIIQTIFFKKIGDKLRPGSLKRINDLYYAISEKVLSKFDVFYNEYLIFYEEVLEKEIKIADIKKDKILVIGCGTIPSTCILLAKKTDSTITGIDIDKKALDQAKKYVKRQNLEGKIFIEYGNGLNYKVKNFDKIFILFGIKNRDEVFSNLFKNTNSKTKIIYRVPIDFKISDYTISNNFNIISEVQTSSFGKMKSIVLQKKR